MRCQNISTNSPGAATCDVQCNSTGHRNIVKDEHAWRVLHPSSVASSADSRVIATRWRAINDQTEAFGAETAPDYHVVKIVLRNMNIRLSLAGRTVRDGAVTPGMYHVTEPGAPVNCVFRGPYDALHLHIPNDLIGECARDMPGHEPAVHCAKAALNKDAMVGALGRALLDANRIGDSVGQLYADYLSVAIVARILAPVRPTAGFGRRKVDELAPWRLKRTIDYIEARLGEAVRLDDIAAVTGLSPMYFAAQFKAATGLRPHEYLLRRRIERAQEMLANSATPLVEVALSVGFQSQAHFTTVFKRFVGNPPNVWRRFH